MGVDREVTHHSKLWGDEVMIKQVFYCAMRIGEVYMAICRNILLWFDG